MALNFKFWETPKQTTPEKVNVSDYIGTHKMSLNSILSDGDLDLSKPIIEPKLSANWIPFGQDNLYPYQLLDIYNSSPFHAAVVEFKANMIFKSGITYSFVTNGVDEQLKLEKLKRLFTKDFLHSFAQDFILHQRIHLKINRKGASEKIMDNITTIESIEPEKVRFTASDKWQGVWVADDWRKRSNPIAFKEYDKFYKGTDPSVLTFQRLTKGFPVYAVPVYTKASNWIYLDGEMAFFQKQNMQNSINPSAIITLFQTFESEEKKKKFIEGLTSAFAGARNAGKALVLTAKDPSTAPKFDIADANKLDEAFVDIQETVIKNISYVHLINPVIMGVATQGKLGTTQEIQDAFSIFRQAYLIPTQEILEDYLTIIATDVFGLKGQVIINKDVNLL
jgi:hypothetical protein